MRNLLSCLILSTFLSACAAGNALHNSAGKKILVGREPNAMSPIKMGIDQWPEVLPYLRGKRVGVICNHSSINREGVHLLDLFLQSDLKPTTIFALEHGIRGDAADGDSIRNGRDEKTGAAIISLYGPKKSPSEQDLANLDVLVFDIQDVGVRTYTYLSSLKLLLEASSRTGKEFILLDRPNPQGRAVAGPTLKPGQESFVGALTIPLVYGLTLGEISNYLWQEDKLPNPHPNFRLRIVPLENYDPFSAYAPPKAPSPNLPNLQAIQLYPSLVFFEASQFSVGRGTDFPFQVVGSPDPQMGPFTFTPQKRTGVSDQAPHLGKKCFGRDLRNADPKFSLSLFWELYRKDPKNFLVAPRFLDNLYGEQNAVENLKRPLKEVEKNWSKEIKAYLPKAAAAKIYTSQKKLDWSSLFQEAIVRGVAPGASLKTFCQGSPTEVFAGHHTYNENHAVDAESIYDLASLTKLFTATAILQLRERGKLKLQDPVAKYLPELDSPEKTSVTIEHLLLHSSGLPAANSEKDYDLQNPENSWAKIYHLPLRKIDGRFAKPGEFFHYSDIGYLLLGKIVETVSGERLDLYMSNNIFGPLGMKSSGYKPKPSPRIVPTGGEIGRPHDERSRWLGDITGHAGIFSTLQDLSRFVEDLLSPSDSVLLRSESKKELWQARGPGKMRAYGWDVDSPYSLNLKQGKFWSTQARSHSGFSGTSITVDLLSGNYFILLTNRVLPSSNPQKNIQWLRRRVSQTACF